MRADSESFLLGGDEFGDTRVGQHGALGTAGGAGGVDDVGGVRGRQLVCGGGALGGVGGQFGERVRGVEDQRVQARREVGGDLRGGDEAHRAGVGEHVRDAVGRVVGVDGQIGGARLQDGDLGHDHVGGARYGERDDLFGSGAPGHQRVRQLRGAGVEFGVGEADVLVDEGDLVRAGGDLVGEHTGPGERGHVVRGVVPVVQDAVPLVGAEEFEVGDLGVRAGEGVGEEGAVVAEDQVDGGGGEEVGAVVRRHLPVGHGEGQVQWAALVPGVGAEASGAQQAAAAEGFGGEEP